MTGLRVRALAVLILAIAASVAAHAWRPVQRLADTRPRMDLEQLFPKSFGEWVVDTRGPVQLISPDQQALLNKIYNQTLSRVYVNRSGDRVMLSVAYGGDQSDGTRAHRPEVCYPAQGFSINGLSESVSLSSAGGIPVRRLVAKQGNRVEPITYWIVVGDVVALSGTAQKLAQLRYSLRGTIPDGILVRISSIDADSTRAYSVHARFQADLHGVLAPAARLRVFGVTLASAQS